MISIALLLLPLLSAPAPQADALRLQVRVAQSDGTPLDGLQVVVVKLYSSASGGTALWTEALGVFALDGVVSTSLGASTPFPAGAFDGGERWFGLAVNGDVEMTPRLQLASVPYAKRAETLAAGATLPASSVSSGAIQDGAVAASKLASSSVTSTKIAAGAVTGSAMADGAVTATKLGAGSVTSAALGAGSVTSTALGANSVTTTAIAPNAVNSSDLASDAASLAKVSAGNLAAIGSSLVVGGGLPAGKLNLRSASTTAAPQLVLTESSGSYARLGFASDTAASSWVLAGRLDGTAAGDKLNVYHPSAGDVLSVSALGRVGIETVDPLTALHVAGSLHLQGTSQDISVQTGEQMQFGHYNGTVFNERMRIDGAGVVHTTGNLDVGGQVTVPVTMRWQTVSGADFVPTLNAVVTANALGAFVESAVGTPLGFPVTAVAPLHLPHGAQIVELTAHFDDSSTTFGGSLALSRKAFGLEVFPDTLATVSSTGFAGSEVRSTSSITGASVDAHAYAYYVKFTTTKTLDPGGVSLGEVRIAYTVSGLLP